MRIIYQLFHFYDELLYQVYYFGIGLQMLQSRQLLILGEVEGGENVDAEDEDDIEDDIEDEDENEIRLLL